MENIIRSNAVKIESLGSSLGIKLLHPDDNLALKKASIYRRTVDTDSAIARTSKVAIRQQLPALLCGRGVLWTKIVIWVWTGKIAEVGYTPGNNIKTLMARMILTATTPRAIAVVEAQATPKGLVKLVCFLKEQQKLLRTLDRRICSY